ncbi:sodium channel protein type 4 subunit alpha A-like [Salarias fasciatus]|uniref:sodium channel protein type 4 subunit alpha A-like n=1 Tax=Salarias fasciatus TaxID=181472 RepID=UPI001176BFBF|nr:sodium channel protein type 4 subunit alpha A-like [Salarias fasciatus]
MACSDCCGRAAESREPRLSPEQLSRLLGDAQVREDLQEVGVASLLPPVGTTVFRRFTMKSMQEVKQQQEAKRQMDKQGDDGHLHRLGAQLREGEPLPFFYGAPPPELLYTPLEELDPFYQSQKTFVVLSRGDILHRFDADSSLYLLSPVNRLRTLSIKILLSPWFQWFVLVTLLLNCLFMTLPDSLLTGVMECVFLAVYSAEALLRVLSRGFCLRPFSFLRDAWNWIDLLVLCTAFPSLFLDLGKCQVLVIIPRVLKIFSASPGLRRTVEALLGSARRFVHVSVVTVAVLCLLAIVSTQLFMGDLRNKCVWAPPGLDSNQTSTPGYDYNTGFYSNDNNNNSHNEYYKHVTNPGNHFRRPGHLDPLLCGNRTTAGSCPDGFLCLRVGDNPNYGYTSYDSFFWSLLSAFRFLTQDYWENLMQMTLRAAGAEYVLFLVLAVFPTCFLVLSLLLAVVVMVIVDQDKATIDRKKLREEQFRRIEEALMRMKKEEEKDVGGVVLPSEGSTVTVAMTEADVDSTLSSHWQRLRLWLRLFVLSPLFDLGVILCLVVNTVVMAMEGYPMTEQFELVSSGLHLVFSFIFVVEMLLRMSVLGLRGFFQVSWHILDFLVVISFLLEFSLAHVSGVSMLRCLRLLRMFRLARWWPSLQLFLQVVWSSAQSLALVLLVLVFLWTVVGLQLFGTDYVTNVCRIADDCELPRWHMADLSHAVMLVFRVLYGEWIETLWDCMAVSGPGTCVAYFIPILVIGKLLVLFLFLNLFLNSTTNEKLAALEGKTDPRISKVTQICRRAGQTHQPDHRTEGHEEESLSLTPMTSESAQVHKVTESPDEDPKKPPTDPGQNRDEENHKELIVEDCCCSFCPLQDGDTSRGSWSDFRRICLLIVENRVFKGFMLFIILLSCMALSFEDVHLEDRRVLSLVLDWADLVFTLVFLVEMVLKWSGFGFRKYFSDVCCWLDFLVLDVSLLALVLEAAGVYCRPLRALRTLRTLSRFQGVRVVLRCLWAALPSLVDVQLVVLFVWLAFGILGVNLFAGKFFYCFNETSQEIFIPDAVNNRSDCLALIDAQFNEIRWKRFLLHFDNVHASYVSMLILGTSRGLFDLLYAATDSRGVELQPAFEHSLYMSLYFLGFMIFGGFFSFQLFIRVFLRALQQHGPQFGGKHLFMTEKQQIYSEGFKKRFSRPWSCLPPQGACRSRVLAVASSRWLEAFMMAVIFLDVVLLGIDSLDVSELTYAVLYFFHFALILVFLLEFLLKITAFGRCYFRSALNVVDVTVLVLCIVNLFVSDLMERYFLKIHILVVLRLARLVRVLRFCSATRGIRTLFLGFVMSLPALANIGVLLFILTFSFSVVGMFAFGHTRPAFSVDDQLNFQTFWSSLTTMTLVAPSTSWSGLLLAFMDSPPDCDPDPLRAEVRGECASPVAGVLFFASYILLFILLVVLLFIAVVLESFNARIPEDSENPKTPRCQVNQTAVPC